MIAVRERSCIANFCCDKVLEIHIIRKALLNKFCKFLFHFKFNFPFSLCTKNVFPKDSRHIKLSKKNIFKNLTAFQPGMMLIVFVDEFH